jgi:hypothetical protein
MIESIEKIEQTIFEKKLIASSDLFFKKYTYKNEFYGDYEEILNYI